MSEDVCESWEDWLIKEDNKVSSHLSVTNLINLIYTKISQLFSLIN